MIFAEGLYWIAIDLQARDNVITLLTVQYLRQHRLAASKIEQGGLGFATLTILSAPFLPQFLRSENLLTQSIVTGAPRIWLNTSS